MVILQNGQPLGLYKISVRDNPLLSDVEKFSYLQTFTCKNPISGLALTEINYAEAISILESHFGNRERIISKHMEALLSVEHVS